MGINIEAVLEEVVNKIPPPKGDSAAPLRAMVFDSQYDSYRGVIVYIRLIDGEIRKDMDIFLMATGASYKVVEVGHMRATGLEPCDVLRAGEVGYFTASIKTVADTQVGDTVTETVRPTAKPLPGYRPARPMVFSGIYTADGTKLQPRDALESQAQRRRPSFEPESSGSGFRPLRFSASMEIIRAAGAENNLT